MARNKSHLTHAFRKPNKPRWREKKPLTEREAKLEALRQGSPYQHYACGQHFHTGREPRGAVLYLEMGRRATFHHQQENHGTQVERIAAIVGRFHPDV